MLPSAEVSGDRLFKLTAMDLFSPSQPLVENCRFGYLVNHSDLDSDACIIQYEFP